MHRMEIKTPKLVVIISEKKKFLLVKGKAFEGKFRVMRHFIFVDKRTLYIILFIVNLIKDLLFIRRCAGTLLTYETSVR